MTTFRQLLDQFEQASSSKSGKGRFFEDFCEEFLQVDPYWANEFDEVWSWMDWPGRAGRTDTGIDLVARERGTGFLVAIQCKFYSPRATLNWKQVSTFVGMLGSNEFISGLIISTAGKESKKVHQILENDQRDIRILRVDHFEDSNVNWDRFNINKPNQLSLRAPKRLRPHQEEAVESAAKHLGSYERGQMIMACGTGKTYTSLKLAERVVGAGGTVLFLVPSINLLSQSVKAWANDAEVPLNSFAICSDTHAGTRAKNEDMSVNDLAIPASTDSDALLGAMDAKADDSRMTVVFSTYQSIDIVSSCQRALDEDGLGLDAFDLIICDEAHRTTGASNNVDELSPFQKVHHNDFVAGNKRIYMTATPRVYGDQTKAKAADKDVLVTSMDDPDLFGEVCYELPFGDAVARKLLTDYKVLVLAVNDKDVSDAFQTSLADDDAGLALDDVARMVGCWHGLSKRGPQFSDDSQPMKRVVAFSNTIKQSEDFVDAFPKVVNRALENRSNSNAVKVETQHVDGKTNIKVRSESVAWLEEPPGQGVCRVLSNARCLTEGVDVPALDAVMFLQPRKSLVDVVQAVGRVMRLAEGKDFGYVILPIVVPSGVAPHEALKNSKKYQVVWQVLQALRSHDERLAAEINKINLNRGARSEASKDDRIGIIGIGVAGGDSSDDPGSTVTVQESVVGGTQLAIPDLDEWREALYVKVVEKVGDRRYMDSWADDIAAIAAAQETRIRTMLDHPEQNTKAVERFDVFLAALRNNLNDAIGRDDAIGMLSQHLITRPVFEALFGGEDFTKLNPVSQVMQSMLNTLDDANLETETKVLEGFYDHIRMLVGGIHTAEGRQEVITELYEKFFKKALPKTADALGIVYTPVEIVDFINRSVNDLLGIHFDGVSLADEGVHILDPFAGTGTFIARLIQSGLIPPDALARKYKGELHSNEIMLLAYYIAAINIEIAFNNSDGVPEKYEPFEGMVLTDTFQLAETGDPMDEVFFPRNNARADRQKELDIRVIVGNPPYSVGQTSQNDDNQNLAYPTLDASIANTYAKHSTATNKNSLYDSYIRAIRWGSNRLASSPNGGVLGFVSNGGWLDGNTADGLRHCLQGEFHHVYVFNLRGNQRTTGERSRQEGGKVFGSGSRNTVAITLLVKKAGPVPDEGAHIRYRDIGDYLTREEKLSIVDEATIDSIVWSEITPNPQNDWLNQRNPAYDNLVPLSHDPGAIFQLQSRGLMTGRDAWVYSSSKAALRSNVESMIDFYNQQLDDFTTSNPPAGKTKKVRTEKAKAHVLKDGTRFAWDRSDYGNIAVGRSYRLGDEMLRCGLYRPFFKQQVAFDKTLNGEVYQLPKLYPNSEADNLGLLMMRQGTNSFALVPSRCVSDLNFFGAGHPTMVFARWRYEPSNNENTLLDELGDGRMSNLNPAGVKRFKDALGNDIDDDAVFNYVYGVLHSPDFRREFETSLKKEGPRVPLVEDRATFDAFAEVGSKLLELHLNYETVEPYPLDEEWRDNVNPQAAPELLLVGKKKMAYPKVVDPETGKKVADKTRLLYNSHLTLTGIPPEAHEYVLGTRSGIDWLIDRYYIKTDKKSGIVNDVNKWGLEHGNPRYIIDLVKRITTVSVETVKIVDKLPTLKF